MKYFKYLEILGLVLVFSGCVSTSYPGLGTSYISGRSSPMNSYEILDRNDTSIPFPKNTKFIEKFTVINGSCSGKDCYRTDGLAQRMEREFNVEYVKNKKQWYQWSFYIPKNFKSIEPGQTCLEQFYLTSGSSHSDSVNPIYMFILYDGYTLKCTKGCNKGTWEWFYRINIIPKKELYGKWHTIKVFVHWINKDPFNYDDKRPVLKIWADGKLKVTITNINTPQHLPINYIFLKYGLYQSHINRYFFTAGKKTTPTQTLYQANFKKADTEDGLKQSNK